MHARKSLNASFKQDNRNCYFTLKYVSTILSDLRKEKDLILLTPPPPLPTPSLVPSPHYLRFLGAWEWAWEDWTREQISARGMSREDAKEKFTQRTSIYSPTQSSYAPKNRKQRLGTSLLYPKIGVPCHSPYPRYRRSVVRSRDSLALWHRRVTNISFPRYSTGRDFRTGTS